MWPMFICNRKLRVSAPDNTTIVAGVVITENLHVNSILDGGNVIAMKRIVQRLVYHEQKWLTGDTNVSVKFGDLANVPFEENIVK